MLFFSKFIESIENIKKIKEFTSNIEPQNQLKYTLDKTKIQSRKLV